MLHRVGMFFIIFFTSVTLLGSANLFGQSSRKVAVCYYMTFSRYYYPASEIEYENLTHICHAFIWPDSSGNLVVDKNFLYPDLISEAHKHGVKVLISLGGWGHDKGFRPTAADPGLRKNFIDQLVKFCADNNYDGADVDWEYPVKKDNKNLVALVSEMRSAFNKAGIKYLTMALPSEDYRNGFDVKDLEKYVDWFGIMTYDFHGQWSNHSGHNSPLYSSPLDSCGSVDGSVDYYIGKGVPRDKLCIGMAFYGQVFNSNLLYSPNKGGANTLYFDISGYEINGWNYKWDPVSKTPYLEDPKGEKTISFDDQYSIKRKCFYILDNDLKGAIVWALGQDFDGYGQPLLETIGRYLMNPPDQIPAVPLLAGAKKVSDTDSTDFIFSWRPAARSEYYGLQVSSDSLFSGVIVDQKNIHGFSYTVKNLTAGFPIYWRVKASNYIGTSMWSWRGEIKK